MTALTMAVVVCKCERPIYSWKVTALLLMSKFSLITATDMAGKKRFPALSGDFCGHVRLQICLMLGKYILSSTTCFVREREICFFAKQRQTFLPILH